MNANKYQTEVERMRDALERIELILRNTKGKAAVAYSAAYDALAALEAAPVAAKENRIVRVQLNLTESGAWEVAVTKEFEAQYGGGSHVFRESAGSIHRALDIARGMVTFSTARNPEASR